MRRRLLAPIQKASDWTDYLIHRIRMKLTFQTNRVRHWLRFRDGVHSILVVRIASIGDVARSTGILGVLRRRYPDARIDFLASDPTVTVIANHPALGHVYTPSDMARLPTYDWVINLQNTTPPDSFLASSGLTYPDILARLSALPGCRFVTGRHLVAGREVTPTNVLYCRTEVEEHFLIALQPFDAANYPQTTIAANPDAATATKVKFNLPSKRPLLAIFLGSNSVGCGADEGFRTYSIGFLEQLIARFSDRFAIVMIGQSHMRNAAELAQYRETLTRYPDVIDLVDKTTLSELVALMDRFAALISCDSSPIHLAIARNVPVVGLFVSDARFRLHSSLEEPRFIALNSAPPCFEYSWRWKFFCWTCRNPATRAAYCVNDTFVFGVDRIPIDRIDGAVSRLLPQVTHAAAHS